MKRKPLKKFDYLSWNKIQTIEKGAWAFKKSYIDCEFYENEYMRLGKKFADGIEKGYSSNKQVQALIDITPDCKVREAEMHAKFGEIELYGKFDGWDEEKFMITEYKTGKQEWNYKRVADSGQLMFYCFIVWINTKKIPKCRLIWYKTDEADGELFLTGERETFDWQFDLADMFKMASRAKRAYKNIIKVINEYK